jgi:hypothetical protein
MTNPNDTFVYEPVFGERAAFRLKSIVETKDGRKAVRCCNGLVGSFGCSLVRCQHQGFGRVSIMTGELADSEYEASIVLEDSSSTGTDKSVGDHARLKQIIESMDLPTRLLVTSPPKDCIRKPTWTGKIKAGTVAGISYPAVQMTVQNIPFEK